MPGYPDLPEGTLRELSYLLMPDEQWSQFLLDTTEDGLEMAEFRDDGTVVFNDPGLAQMDAEIRRELGLT